LLRLRIEAISHPDEVKKLSQRQMLRLEGKPYPPRYETIFLKKDGAPVPVDVTESKTVWLAQPAVLRIIRDITLRKRIEEKLGRLHQELEQRVKERTQELMETTEKLEQKQKELLDHKLELEEANKELMLTSTALSVLARNIDKKRDEVVKKIAQTIGSQIIPLLEDLKMDKLQEKSRAKLEVLSVYLNDLTPDATKGHDIIVSLSAMELKVAVMIKNGFSSDDIARLLHISPHTVKTHRRSIRKKLHIKNSKINLASYLKLKMGKMSDHILNGESLSASDN
jgi:DNA-binding CsgD family transcriptional regulator